MILTDEKPNLSRQREFDLVKAIAIIGMVIIHVYEEDSWAECDVLCSSFLDCFIQFIGGPMAAPVFMTAMGMGIVYSSHRQPEALMLRGLKLFGMAYVLNFVRYCINCWILWGVAFDDVFFYRLLNVDILQFAGLSFMLIGLLKKLNVPVLAMGAIAIGMQLLGQGLSSLFTFDSLVARCLFGLVFHTGFESCFPLLNWFIYPVLGIVIAKYLRHVSDIDKYYKGMLGASVTLLAGYCGALVFAGYDLRNFFALADDVYYKQDFLELIFCTLWVLLELSLAHVVLKHCKSERVLKCIRFMSNKLNDIYIVQWLLIGWSELLYEYEIIPWVTMEWVIPAGLIYLGLAIAIVALRERRRGAKV